MSLGTIATAGAAMGGAALSALGLSRATLTVYKPQLPGKGDASRSPSPGAKLFELGFDYNPKELTFSRKAASTEVPTGGTAGAPQQQFQGPKASNQTFELFYSRFEPEILGGAGITTKLEDIANKLLSCLEADPSTTEPGKTPTRPMVQFSWGDIVTNPCFIDDVSITYLMFLPNGGPLRMKCTVTLSEAPFDKKLTNPTSGGRVNRKTHTLLAGETLATVAFKELNDAGLWRAIAEENGIDDPLRIASGTVLLLPTLDEV
jgi:nucleoid-associated protein YgaU